MADRLTDEQIAALEAELSDFDAKCEPGTFYPLAPGVMSSLLAERRALRAEVAALRECAGALEAIVGSAEPRWESIVTPVANWALERGRAALAGVRALREGEPRDAR